MSCDFQAEEGQHGAQEGGHLQRRDRGRKLMGTGCLVDLTSFFRYSLSLCWQGPLTFSTGMRIKMALSRWEAWASEAGVTSDTGTSPPFYDSTSATSPQPELGTF